MVLLIFVEFEWIWILATLQLALFSVFTLVIIAGAYIRRVHTVIKKKLATCRVKLAFSCFSESLCVCDCPCSERKRLKLSTPQSLYWGVGYIGVRWLWGHNVKGWMRDVFLHVDTTAQHSSSRLCLVVRPCGRLKLSTPQSLTEIRYISVRPCNRHIRLTALCPELPRWAGTRKVKPIWILLKQATVSGSGISWPYASLHLVPDR